MEFKFFKSFFIEIDIGWEHNRCNQEIHKYQAKIEQASKAGKASAEKRFNARSTPVQPIINQESLIINQESNKKIGTPSGVAESVWNDYLKVRKSAKKPITETALKGLVREADKANMTLEQALTICIERSWVGFNADWLKNINQSNKPADKIKNFWLQIEGQ